MDESEKVQEEGDVRRKQREKYLQHLQQREDEEDEGWSDEESEEGDQKYFPSLLAEGGDAHPPADQSDRPVPHAPGPPPPPPASVTSPSKGVKLRIKKSPDDAPPLPPSPGPPPPPPASVTSPSKAVKLRIKKLPDDVPPPPPSPGPPPPPPPSVSSPSKSVKLKVKAKPGEAPAPPPSPGPPPPIPPSVSSPTKIKYKTKAARTQEDQSEINSYAEEEQPNRSSHDGDAQNYSVDNTDYIDQNYSKGEQNYEADAPMRRSQGYNNLNGDAEDQRELYVNSRSPDSDGQSPTWATDEDGYHFPEGFSEDQQQAMAELQQLRLDLNYAGELL